MNLRDHITEYADFPKEGVLFRDIGPALREPSVLSYMADEFERHFHKNDVDVLAGIESRGFILSSILASRYGKGMIMIRKAGKIPGRTASVPYATEYGEDTMEVQTGIFKKGERVLICDDLLATGGTAKAAAGLVEGAGCSVAGFAFIIELTGLGGIRQIGGYDCRSLVRY